MSGANFRTKDLTGLCTYLDHDYLTTQPKIFMYILYMFDTVGADLKSDGNLVVRNIFLQNLVPNPAPPLKYHELRSFK